MDTNHWLVITTDSSLVTRLVASGFAVWVRHLSWVKGGLGGCSPDIEPKPAPRRTPKAKAHTHGTKR